MSNDIDWNLLSPQKHSTSWKITSKLTLTAVGLFSKVWAEYLNTAVVYNAEILHNAVENREPGQPLITVSNHTSCMDDPVLFGVLKWKSLILQNYNSLRWTPAANDICFTKNLHSCFFLRGKVVPIVRGDGVYQKCMDFLVGRLNDGEWVHTFPEGKINATQKAMRLKWGVGRLIADCNQLPLVIPMWHVGMDTVLPNKRPYIPQIGKKITLLVGDPIDFSPQLQKLREGRKSPMEIRKAITDRIQEEFKTLKEKAEKLHYNSTLKNS